MINCFRKKKKQNKGALTVEATVVLSLFIFLLVTMLSLINVVSLQARMQVALNTSAKQMSQYTYLLSLAGTNEIKSTISTKGGDTSDFLDTVGKTTSNLSSMFDEISFDYETLKSDISTIKSDYSSITSAFKKVKDNPASIIYYLVNIGIDKGLNEIAELVARGLMSSNLNINDTDNGTEKYLKHAGIVPGADGTYISGLDFDGTEFFNDGYWIKLQVSYDVKAIALLPIDFTFHIQQCAITKGWAAGDTLYEAVKNNKEDKKEEKEEDQKKENDSWWITMGDIDRNKFITGQMKTYYEDTEGYSEVSGGFSWAKSYNEKTGSLMAYTSTNILYEKGSVDNVKEEDIITYLNRICKTMSDDVEKAKGGFEIIKTDQNGNENKTEITNTDISGRIAITIPEDEGLREKYLDALQSPSFNSQGIKIEIIAGYGTGVKEVEADKTSEQNESGGGK